jgi:hypothetical protein
MYCIRVCLGELAPQFWIPVSDPARPVSRENLPPSTVLSSPRIYCPSSAWSMV